MRASGHWQALLITLRDGVVLTPPDQTYDGVRATLDLGGRQVEFRTWGIAHSPGDQIVHLPAERIVIAGDLLEERMFPIIPFFPPMIAAEDIDVARWEVALADIIALQPWLIVPGHGNLGGVEIATDALAISARSARWSVAPARTRPC